MLKQMLVATMTFALVSFPTGSTIGELALEDSLGTEATDLQPMFLTGGIIPLPTPIQARKTDARPIKQAVNISSKAKAYRVVKAEVTAYTLGPESTGKRPGDKGYGHVSCGGKVKPTDKVISAPSSIPCGTLVEIPGYGTYKVRDRGSAIKTRKDGTMIFDVLFPTVKSARQWGRKHTEVKIYK